MAQQDNGGAVGIGDDDLDDNGRADGTQDQSETGGSGGAGLTRHEGDGTPAASPATARPQHPANLSGAVGAQDTRAAQAGEHETGLGSAETGANQAPADLAPPARAPDA